MKVRPPFESSPSSVAPVSESSWETSAVYLSGMVKAARSAGLLDPLLPRLTDEARAAIAAPHSKRWHPSRVTTELTTALLETAGPIALEDLAFVVARDSFGPIVGSMAKVALTIVGASPATLFTRLDQSIQTAARGVKVSWTPTDAKSGVIVVQYPVVPPRAVEITWRGAIRFAFHLVGVPGSIADAVRDANDTALRFGVSW